MNSNLIKITDQSLDKILKENKYVVVKFGANWCNPCNMLKSVMEELANDYCTEIIIGDVDIEQNPELTSRYKIKSIPLILFFKDNNIMDKHMGAVPKSYLNEKINNLLN